ncbi:MAG: phenazine antibiotic biosynthesis protein, partial [Candidatus Hydrogenedentes bacterium]|nr:phenazine antibiotic biosynthesis protein [Candidatus Hydrogenedentota bacterium]
MIAPGPLEALLQEHFDPEWGAAFWLERRNALSFDPLREIHSLEDLAQFGPMPMEALAARPVYDFLPRRYHAARHTCVAAETGGTTGPPKRTLYLPGEFQAAVVTPFLAAAEVLHFPRDCDWLY